MLAFIYDCLIIFSILQITFIDIANLQKSSTNKIQTNTNQFPCKSMPYCVCKNNDTLVCTKFNSFKDIRFYGSQLVFKIVILKPLIQLDFDESVDLTGLKIDRLGEIQLHNIKTFHYDMNPLKTLRIEGSTKLNTLKIVNSHLNFMYKNESLSSNCDINYFNNQSLFTNVNYIYLDRINITSPLCPLILTGINVYRLNIDINHIFGDVQFKFMKLELNNTSIDSRIDFVEISSSVLTVLGEDVLPKLLFSKTVQIKFVNNIIENIEPNVFVPLKKLQQLEFDSNLGNYENVFKVNNKWISTLKLNFSPNELKSMHPRKVAIVKQQSFVLKVNGVYDKLFEYDMCKSLNISSNILTLIMNVPKNDFVFECKCFNTNSTDANSVLKCTNTTKSFQPFHKVISSFQDDLLDSEQVENLISDYHDKRFAHKLKRILVGSAIVLIVLIAITILVSYKRFNKKRGHSHYDVLQITNNSLLRKRDE